MKNIERRVKELKSLRIDREVLLRLKIFVLAFIINPWIYGAFYPLISLYKDKEPSGEFEIKSYSDFQAKIALSLLGKDKPMSRQYQRNLSGFSIKRVPRSLAVPAL